MISKLAQVLIYNVLCSRNDKESLPTTHRHTYTTRACTHTHTHAQHTDTTHTTYMHAITCHAYTQHIHKHTQQSTILYWLVEYYSTRVIFYWIVEYYSTSTRVVIQQNITLLEQSITLPLLKVMLYSTSTKSNTLLQQSITLPLLKVILYCSRALLYLQ